MELNRIAHNQPFPRWLIHPDGKISVTWNIVLALLLFYTATIMPYRLAFVEPVMFDEWFYIEILIDVGFFIDVLVNLFTAYYTSDGYLVIDRRSILMTYLRSWMLLDIVAWFPFNYLPLGNDSSEEGRYNTFIRLLRLPRLYRIMKFSRIFKLFKVSYNSYLIKIQDYFKVR
jgi:hypothetical protein